MIVRLILRTASIILSKVAILRRAIACMPQAVAGLRKTVLAHRAIIIGLAAAITIAAALSGPIAVFLEMHSPYDTFGITRLYPPDTGGQHWDSRSWLISARTLTSTQVDPKDPYFQVRGASNTLSIRGDGTSESSGDVVRYYISDPEGKKEWKNFEFTMYSMRVSEVEPP
ncbi:MAG: hypothetical protein ACREAY_08260, partial [Nitrososphaera sp.]